MEGVWDDDLSPVGGYLGDGNIDAVVVQLLSHNKLFATPWAIAGQALLFSTVSPSLLKFMSISLRVIVIVMLSNHFILCCPLLLLPFASGGQSIGASTSASVLPMDIQG